MKRAPKKPALKVVDPNALSPLVEDLIETTVRTAVGFYRAGRPGRGHYELVRGCRRIARLTGDVPSAVALEDLVLVEPFHDPRLGDITYPQAVAR